LEILSDFSRKQVCVVPIAYVRCLFLHGPESALRFHVPKKSDR
jgi:hypothetical protein